MFRDNFFCLDGKQENIITLAFLQEAGGRMGLLVQRPRTTDFKESNIQPAAGHLMLQQGFSTGS